ncbi:class II aldolase/adducin family protein [Trebonia sp.]|uniref:class II aldolase/adducin family protein n=1 Tax=Trebonia sp. TaxID=2767075 RepID=UPI00263033FC|nr:class II aldolase/adducin family protein [Trebonia sp.]
MSAGDTEVRRELVAANRILGHEGILDAFGHVSVRHPGNPGHFLLCRARSPENVELADVLEFDGDGELAGEAGPIPYVERFIHAGVYEARPDVTAVCHNHAISILPFSISRSVRLRATINASAMFGDGVPVWDIAAEFGDSTDMLVRNMAHGRSLARALGAGPVVLMRGHGSVVAGNGLRQVVSRCLDMDRSATAQLAVATLGATRSFTAAELAPHADLPPGATRDDRAWEYLLHRAGLDQDEERGHGEGR